MAQVITYNGQLDVTTGLELDRPSVELLLTKFPLADVINSKLSKAVDVNATLFDVNAFVDSYPEGTTIFCVGGEQVNGIAKNLTKGLGLGFFDPTPASVDGSGFVKSVNYKNRFIFVFTGGTSPTTVLDSRRGTINAVYYLFNNNVPIGDGKNIQIPQFAKELGLYSTVIKGATSEAIELCKKGFVKFTLENLIGQQGYPPESYQVITCYIQGNNLFALIVKTSSPPWAEILWALAIAGATVVAVATGAATLGIPLIAISGTIALIPLVVTGINNILNSGTIAIASAEEAQAKAISGPMDNVFKTCQSCIDSCNKDQKCLDSCKLYCPTVEQSITLTEKSLQIAKAIENISLYNSQIGKGTDIADSFKKIAIGIAVLGGVGLGIYFLFKSGLFEEGIRTTKEKIEQRRKPKEIINTA